MAGFAEFFYNIIPGGLFLLAITATFPTTISDFLQKLPPHKDNVTIAVYLIVSLFLGFAFQMINTLVKIKEIDDALGRKYGDNKKDYALAQSRLPSGFGKLPKNDSGDLINKLKRLHYFMDDYLRFRNTSTTHNFFHVRISLWANTMAASLIYAYITLAASLYSYLLTCTHNFYLILSISSVAVAIFCLTATEKSQEIFCDFVLKTFLMVTGEKNLTNLRK